MSFAREDGIRAANYGDLVFFAGGANTNVIEVYNISSKMWSNITAPSNRTKAAILQLRELLFFAGGLDTSNSPSALVEVYNITAGSWFSTNMTQPRVNLAATYFDDLAFFAGGGNNVDTTYQIIEIFDTNSRTWRTPISLSQARTNLVATSVSGYALFAYGDTEYSYGGQSSRIDYFTVSDTFSTTSAVTTSPLTSSAATSLAATTSSLTSSAVTSLFATTSRVAEPESSNPIVVGDAIGGTVGGIAIVTIIVVLVVVILKKKKKVKVHEMLEMQQDIYLSQSMKIQKLELIGSGQFGKVYKGRIESTTVALKQIVGNNKEDLENESKILL